MRRTGTLSLLLLALGCVGPNPTLRAALDRELACFDAAAVEVAAVVVDCATGERLYARSATRLLRPASTLKLLPTAALAKRQHDREMATELRGEVTADGTKVTLVGAGDAFLTTDELRQLVARLLAAGLVPSERVQVVVVDPLLGSDRFGEGWMWDDEPSSFMPSLSAAPIDGGCVTVVVARDANGHLTASLQPTAGDLELRIEPSSTRSATVPELRVTRGRYQDAAVVRISGDLHHDAVQRERITVPDPARHTAQVLAYLLREAGLARGEVSVAVIAQPPVGEPTARVVMARPVLSALAITNKSSDNLGAELLLRHLGAGPTQCLDAASFARGMAILRDDIAALGLQPAGFRLADGSGVSHYNLVSAELLARLLVAMQQLGGDARRAFVASLPIAGQDGTLAQRMRNSPAAGRVRAKTGTVSGVSNLAGYVETQSGRTLAVVLMMQNFVGDAQPWRDLQDRVCALLSAW